ncbi:MAG: pyridoxal phosphate-dependent aminotransferase [Anaerotignum sp.]|nr:pyridoxal phosphate-dependent aminotransferase [Anaerotignum sp.]
MKNNLSDRTSKVKFSPIREIFDLASKTPGLTRFEVGQPDFATPIHIREASKSAIDEGLIGYTPTNGLQVTREAVSKRLSADFGLEYDPNSEIAITVGASGALYLALRALINPGDEVLRPDPGFATYDEIIKDADGIPVKYPLIPDKTFSVDVKVIESLISEKTKAIIINSPGNPCGNVIDEMQLEEIMDICEKHGLFVISDEAYDKIIYDQKHVPAALKAKDKYNVLTIGSSSKNYAMTGFRIGYAAGDKKLIAEIVKFQSLSSICADYVGQKAYAVALFEDQSETTKMVDEYNRRRQYFVSELNKIAGFNCSSPDGAFYVFVDISEHNPDDWAFTKYLIEQVKVTCIPGSSFGDVGKGFVRFSFATSMEVLHEGIEKLKKHFGTKLDS